MSRRSTDSSSVTRAFVARLVAFVCVSFVVTVGFTLAEVVGTTLPVGVAVTVGTLVAVVILVDSRRTESTEESSGSVWDTIPSWQYGGLHAESGGIARDDRERALEEIRREPEAVERRGEVRDRETVGRDGDGGG